MKKFVCRVMILAAPFLVILLPPTVVLIRGHELLSFKEVTDFHNRKKSIIIGPAYSNPDKYMKLNTTLIRKPRILALGTSRVMQVRDFFFERFDVIL